MGADEPVTPNERVVTKASGRVEFPSAAGTGDEGSYKQRDVGGCRNVATEDGEIAIASCGQSEAGEYDSQAGGCAPSSQRPPAYAYI